MKKMILLISMCGRLAFSAVTATSVWEVWTTGASGNGGCFDPSVGSPGTDRSQQSGSQKTYSDLVINGADSTKATSAGVPLVAADVGNCYNITGGTGFTVKRVVLVSVSGSTGTFNESLGTAASTGGQATMGGALDNLTRPVVVAGNTVYVKATATYTIAATQTFSTAGTVGNPITYIGYTSTRTDGGRVTVQRSSGNISLFSVTAAFRRFYNFIADGNSGGTNVKGFVVTAGGVIVVNSKAMNFTGAGFEAGSGSGGAIFQNCYATGGTSAATAAFQTTASSSAGSITFSSCTAAGNASIGFLAQAASATGRILFLRCIAANNTGSSSYDGFKTVPANSLILLQNSVAYNNGGSGLLINGAGVTDASAVMNSAFIGNGAYGINSDVTNYAASGKYQLLMNYNAFYNNALGARNNVQTGDNDITLTGDPFINGSSMEFSLNNTANQGAALRASGGPGVLQSGGTSYLDIGALQHLDTGGSSIQKRYPFVAKAGPRANPDLRPILHPQFAAGIFWPVPLGQTIGTLVLAGAAIALRISR